MAIDGIGRGGGPPKIDGTPGKVERTGGPGFVVPSKGGASEITSTDSAQILKQVRSGQLSLNAYLKVRVDEAVEHLDGALTSEQMDFIKVQLRNQLQDDPVLADLVKRATGHKPESADS